jgi:hypothetical protein
MQMVSRILVGLVGAFFFVMGLMFWFSLDTQVVGFAIEPSNVLGRASIRADFGGFFLAGGIMGLYAAWKQCRMAAAGAMLLLGLALAGRIISILLDGPAPGGIPPMVVEAVCVAILAWARSGWRRT